MRPQYYRVKVREADTPRQVEIECLDVIDALNLGFNLGNVLKYLWRAGRKTPDALDDLKKARTYIEREIANRTFSLDDP